MMIKAGAPVDEMLDKLLPLLDDGRRRHRRRQLLVQGHAGCARRGCSSATCTSSARASPAGPGARPGRPALDRRRVPARQARQGRRLRPDHAEERAVRQGRRPTFNAGTKVETATVDKRDMTLPLPRGRRLRLHGLGHLRADPRAGGDGRRRRRLPAGEPATSWWPCTRAPRSTSSCRPSSSWWSRTPTRACRATGPPAAPSRRRWRPAPTIQVPLFVTTGEKVKVDTRDGRYLGRVLSGDGSPEQGPQARPRRAVRGRRAGHRRR